MQQVIFKEGMLVTVFEDEARAYVGTKSLNDVWFPLDRGELCIVLQKSTDESWVKVITRFGIMYVAGFNLVEASYEDSCVRRS